MTQFAASRMGGIQPVAGSDVTQDFRNITKGSVTAINMQVRFSLISAGAGFALTVATENEAAAEGVDDLDILLNALFSRLSVSWDPGTYAFNLTPAQLRTVLGALNQRDFGGSFLSGSTVPATGGTPKAFAVTIRIPVALTSYFRDGNIYANGSRRLKDGSITYTFGPSLTPTAVLANGSAVVSGLAITLSSETGAGTEADVGNTWRVNRIANLPTIHQLPPAEGGRLGVFHASPAWTSPVTNWRIEGLEMLTPLEFAQRYQQDRLLNGGYDITQRVTPLLFVERERQFLDFVAHVGRDVNYDAIGGVSAVTVYDIVTESVSPSQVEKVSMEVGAGGPVTVAHPAPLSLPPGTAVPPVLQHLLPARIMPGRLSDGGTGQLEKKSSPADAAASALRAKTQARGIGSVIRRMR